MRPLRVDVCSRGEDVHQLKRHVIRFFGSCSWYGNMVLAGAPLFAVELRWNSLLGRSRVVLIMDRIGVMPTGRARPPGSSFRSLVQLKREMASSAHKRPNGSGLKSR